MRNIEGTAYFSEAEVAEMLNKIQDQVLLDALEHPVRRAWKHYSKSIPNILSFGLLTPDSLIQAVSMYKSLGKENLCLFLDEHHINSLLTHPEFSDWLDPVSKLEIAKNGCLGHLLGIKIVSDAYLHSALRFIDGVHLRYCDEVPSEG